jgi:hypothetical protein
VANVRNRESFYGHEKGLVNQQSSEMARSFLAMVSSPMPASLKFSYVSFGQVIFVNLWDWSVKVFFSVMNPLHIPHTPRAACAAP